VEFDIITKNLSIQSRFLAKRFSRSLDVDLDEERLASRRCSSNSLIDTNLIWPSGRSSPETPSFRGPGQTSDPLPHSEPRRLQRTRRRGNSPAWTTFSCCGSTATIFAAGNARKIGRGQSNVCAAVDDQGLSASRHDLVVLCEDALRARQAVEPIVLVQEDLMQDRSINIARTL